MGKKHASEDPPHLSRSRLQLKRPTSHGLRSLDMELLDGEMSSVRSISHIIAVANKVTFLKKSVRR